MPRGEWVDSFFKASLTRPGDRERWRNVRRSALLIRSNQFQTFGITPELVLRTGPVYSLDKAMITKFGPAVFPFLSFFLVN